MFVVVVVVVVVVVAQVHNVLLKGRSVCSFVSGQFFSELAPMIFLNFYVTLGSRRYKY